ncbi:phage portal protein [Sinorhizobium medicae WSM1115]|uniref:phage portal protein n=1 Tax=Sinorhizobium medicae TaxID=110321 RepID=UPI00036FBD4B|nr:phage portal protein [Sinorhizobium medicae]UFX01146.1 phage portal protein [Sinorhizobium medicae WSM1115]
MIKWFSKALTGMRHAPRPLLTSGLLRRTRFDYRREIGDCLDASVVTAPVQWVQRSLPEARLTVMRYGRGGKVDDLADHDMLSLIARPNEYYGDIALWSGTVLSYCIAGNAYWLKARNGVGRPAELWYVPHWTMKPYGREDGSSLLSHYVYSPGGGIEPIKVEPADVVHFRHGIDPRDPRLGISPLDGAIREIFMDLESSNFVASLLRNMGVPGVVISPRGGVVPAEDVEATKAWFQQAFGGDRRGGPLVMGAPTDVAPYGFNPQQMNMSEARDVAEERVCASLGIPAAVVGFGAGLQSTKVGATMAEMRKLAWHNGVLPIGRVFADEIDRSLLPDFGPATGRVKTVWDTSEVLALADDEDKETERWNKRVQGGWVMVSEAREAAGLDVDDSHKIYLRPISVVEVAAGAPPRDGQATEEPKERGEKAVAPLQARRAGTRFLRLVAAQEEPRARAFEERLKVFFKELGKAARQAALPLIEEEDLSPKEKAIEEKSDELLVARILDALGIGTHWTTFRQMFEAQYLEVAKEVSQAAELAGISGSLPDPVGRAVAAAGGRRAGLIDLSAQSKAALFDAIAEGRAEGLGATQLATRIADHVEGGPWASPEIRARIIARTETKYAQNISTIERGRAAGVERFIIFDGRLGPGRSLPSHIARNGGIVTAAEAMQMAAAEHPNGTLSFSPYFGDDQDEE